jgi:hypothetical protein
LVLLPSRGPFAFFAPLGALLEGVAFFADLAFFFATLALCGATRAFLVALGSSATAAGTVPVSVVDVMMFSPCAVITAITTSITPVRSESKWILSEIVTGDGVEAGQIASGCVSW